MEGRMTVCNMAIEAGARAGMVAVDQTTIDYVKGRDFAPKAEHWDAAVADWQQLVSDDDAVFDTVIEIDGSAIEPAAGEKEAAPTPAPEPATAEEAPATQEAPAEAAE